MILLFLSLCMNILQSIWTYKCPRCRKGDIFIQPLKFKSFLEMPETCSNCGQKTMPEPGFYYGSMFISYIFTAFLYLGIVGSLIYFLDWSVNQSFLFLILFVILTYIPTTRLSRSVWIHFIVKYDPRYIK
jgi:uncharacterized protein (DUF983 family)